MLTLLGSVLLLCLLGVLSFSRRPKVQVRQSSGQAMTVSAPSKRISLNGVFEIITEFIDGLVVKIIGKSHRSLTPIFATMFIVILINNIVGLVPGMTPSTDNINTTLAMGVASFLLYNILGFKAHGWRYLKHFLGHGPIFLVPMMLILELVSHLVRPMSLGLRLWGNMTGDHLVLAIFVDLMSYFFVPLAFYGLAVFVCAMQAFVFTILSIIYTSMAVSHDH